MKLLLHTTLFVNGSPVGYKIYFDINASRYYFRPGTLSTNYPHVYVSKAGNQWRVEGSNDLKLQKQVIEDVTNVTKLRSKK